MSHELPRSADAPRSHEKERTLPGRVIVISPSSNTGWALQVSARSSDPSPLSPSGSDDMTHMLLHLSIHLGVVSWVQTASYVLDLASSMRGVFRESDSERFSRSVDERKTATGTGFSHEVIFNVTVARSRLFFV